MVAGRGLVARSTDAGGDAVRFGIPYQLGCGAQHQYAAEGIFKRVVCLSADDGGIGIVRRQLRGQAPQKLRDGTEASILRCVVLKGLQQGVAGRHDALHPVAGGAGGGRLVDGCLGRRQGRKLLDVEVPCRNPVGIGQLQPIDDSIEQRPPGLILHFRRRRCLFRHDGSV
ncbi:hypothetical protein TSH7_28490 [Azospirillum sp. TSH7]|nr:hypothetical protein TSH20_33385 [Azospirillum sp. TSH20]PWC56309.1 hypothetical protein TSH7_28490 [Azospirillum sp. TSH7]